MAFHLKTHNDLDAVASRIIIEVAGFTVASTTYHDYKTIDDSVITFIRSKKYAPGDTLLLTDICPTQGTFTILERELPKDLNLSIIDHHKTRSWASKYPWVSIDVTKCATELVFDIFCSTTNINDKHIKLVKSVAAWDLWMLSSEYRARGENLNTLLGFVGRDNFVRLFVQNPEADKEPTFVEILKYLTARKDRYVYQVIKDQLINAKLHMDGLGNRFKIIFATDFLSEIGNAVLTNTEAEDLQYVCLINPVDNTCSMRARAGETDVAEIAKQLNGGGHAAAAGFPVNLTPEIDLTVFKLLNSLDR